MKNFYKMVGGTGTCIFCTPTKNSRISSDQFISSDYYPSFRMSLIISEQRQLKREGLYIEGKTVDRGLFLLENVKLLPSKSELKDFI